MSTKIIGFDPASLRNLGWSIIDYDDTNVRDSLTCSAGTFVTSVTEEPWQVLWPLSAVVDGLLEAQKPDSVVIEQTSIFGGNRFVTGQIANCIGVILACCGKYSIPVKFVHPTHVKKVLTGDGKASKSKLKKETKRILDDNEIVFDSEHACDATANILCWLLDNKIIEDGNGQV